MYDLVKQVYYHNGKSKYVNVSYNRGEDVWRSDFSSLHDAGVYFKTPNEIVAFLIGRGVVQYYPGECHPLVDELKRRVANNE